MAIIFNGKEFAQEKEEKLKKEILVLKKKGITPKLVSLIVGDDKASKLFLSLKKKAAEGIGAKIKVRKLHSSAKVSKIINLIDNLNNDDSVRGIMIQLPLPKNFSGREKEKIISSIDLSKDVDGMRDDSPYLAPSVKAVLKALKEASRSDMVLNSNVVVVGTKGFVGKKLIKVLNEMDYKVIGVDLETKDLGKKTKDADILISATGNMGLIKADMVKKGAIVIDLGAPKGDVDFDQVAKKASFITPVPGGIGPMTISYLLENLIEAAKINLH